MSGQKEIRNNQRHNPEFGGMRGSTEGIHTQATPQEKVGPKNRTRHHCVRGGGGGDGGGGPWYADVVTIL